MRLHATFFCIFLWTIGVVGNLLAGPYQTMYFWYAYRMEVQAFGPGTAGRTIARDCVGTVPDKTCYFDEFLKHISWEPWNGKTGVGKDLDLDTQTGVGDLKSESYPNEWHPHNLLPLIYKDPDTERTRFETVMRKVTDAIQKCRSTKHIETSSDFLRDLNNARDALQGTHEARREDQAAKCIQDINSKLQDSGVDWSVETQRVTGAVTGTTWEEMDTEATLRAHPDATDNVRAGVLGWVNGFNSEEGDNANHYKWIQNIQQQSFRVYGDPDC